MTGETITNASAPVAGYVLAGGGSKRFGRDKALVEIDGQPMLWRMCQVLGAVTRGVQVIAPPGKYTVLGIHSVADRWPGEGPLGGIITALQHAAARPAPCEWSLVCSCDMPFLTPDWMAFLVHRAAQSAAQVVLPRSAYGLEPLCAGYRSSAMPALIAGFESGTRKVTAALQQLTLEVLDEAVWKRFDNAGRLFWNMNTRAEYDEACRMMGEERP